MGVSSEYFSSVLLLLIRVLGHAHCNAPHFPDSLQLSAERATVHTAEEVVSFLGLTHTRTHTLLWPKRSKIFYYK